MVKNLRKQLGAELKINEDYEYRGLVRLVDDISKYQYDEDDEYNDKKRLVYLNHYFDFPSIDLLYETYNYFTKKGFKEFVEELSENDNLRLYYCPDIKKFCIQFLSYCKPDGYLHDVPIWDYQGWFSTQQFVDCEGVNIEELLNGASETN